MTTAAITTSDARSGLALHEEHSILGERQVRIPVGGKIRGGIKALTQAAAKHPKAKAIYDAGVAAGKAFGVIEKELIAACGFERSPLTPKNVPYFTARASDFSMPEIADAIMDLYGEDRGEGRHLYRFPVIFPTDSWQAIMPHGLKHYSRSELLHWSEYGTDGARYCMQRAAVTMDPKSKRAHRTFGGRQAVMRPENSGLCAPDKCPEYQARQCNLSGAFLFYIPGAPGAAAIELPNPSFPSMKQARQTWGVVSVMRAGHISGTIDGKPIFYLAKEQREVSMIDPETGKAKKVKQWLIELVADIDMTRILIAAERPALLAAGAEAAHALENQADEELDGDETGEPAVTIQPPESLPAPVPQAAVETPEVAAIKEARRKLMESLGFLGLDVNVFNAYAVRTWGDTWGRTLATLKTANDELNLAGDDLDGYLVKIAGAE